MRETGATSPDIALLPQLARLLKIDLNTLFCFQEELTAQEVALFCSQVFQIFQEQGFSAAFADASEKIRQFPNHDPLLLNLALQTQSHLSLSELPEPEKASYEKTIQSWYQQLAGSADPQISDYGKYMLASGYIRQKAYDKAQAVLDTMPDRQSAIADKQMLQVTIHQHTGKQDRAVKELQQALLLAAQKVQMLMSRLVDAELSAGNLPAARQIAEKSSRLPALLDLWEYNAYPDPLQVALWEKEEEKTIRILKRMLHSMTKTEAFTDSVLFYRLPSGSNLSHMLPMILKELEEDPSCDFLRENGEWEQLIRQYREKL